MSWRALGGDRETGGWGHPPRVSYPNISSPVKIEIEIRQTQMHAIGTAESQSLVSDTRIRKYFYYDGEHARLFVDSLISYVEADSEPPYIVG